MNEKKEIKICQVIVVDGTTEDIQKVSELLNRIKEKTGNNNYEFLVSNQTVEMKSVDFLIEALTELKTQK